MKHISLAFGTSLFCSIVMHIIYFFKKDQMLWEVVLLFGTFFSINTYSKLLCVYRRAYTYVFEKNILGKREREREPLPSKRARLQNSYEDFFFHKFSMFLFRVLLDGWC